MFALHRYPGTRLKAGLETQEPKGTINQACKVLHKGKRKANETPRWFLCAPVGALQSSLLRVHPMLAFDGIFRAQTMPRGAQQHKDLQCFDVFCWKRPSVLEASRPWLWEGFARAVWPGFLYVGLQAKLRHDAANYAVEKRYEKGKMCQHNCSKFLYLHILKAILVQNLPKQMNLLILSRSWIISLATLDQNIGPSSAIDYDQEQKI